MKQMSLTKFAQLIQDEQIHTILFNSMIQNSCVLADVVVDGEFKGISVMLNPNRVLISNPGDKLHHRVCFSRVRAIIDYNSEESSKVSEYGIVCGDSFSGCKQAVYRISIIKSM